MFHFIYLIKLLSRIIKVSIRDTVPLVILLQGFGRRRSLVARPLLKEAGIGSIILENPYCILAKNTMVYEHNSDSR